MAGNRLAGLFAALFLAIAPPALAAEEELLPESRVGDNGLHIQDWFLQSFLDIDEDLTLAQEAGKGLVIVFEQAGCPYCREMHEVNLRQPAIVEYMQANFDVLQLDMRGAREVTDTDGEALPERELARKWGVVFTPTLIFLPKDADTAGKPANEAAAAVMPGYFKPFHFATMFEFVGSGAWKEKHFQEFLDQRATKLRAEGKDAAMWE